jgi:hypothetical protein
MNAIYSSFKKRTFLPVAFLDISKAFDSVWHNGLLFKLFNFGIRGRCFRWIKAFLSNRRFKLVQLGVFSDWYPVNAGVPQGSVLSPLLFLVFINDLPSVVANCMSPFFADDIVMWPRLLSTDKCAALNSDLAAVSRWCHKWGLVLSDKSVTVLFHEYKYILKHVIIPSFILNNFILSVESGYTYMGLYFHQNMCWSSHYNNMVSSLCKRSYSISRLVGFDKNPSAHIVRNLVVSLLYSRVAYGFSFWLPSTTQLKHLQAIILKPLRAVLGLHRHVHCNSIFVELNLPSLTNYRFALQVKALYRFNLLHRSNPVSRTFSSCLSLCSARLSSSSSRYTVIPWLLEVMQRLKALHMYPVANAPPKWLHAQLTWSEWCDEVKNRVSDHGAAALKLFHGAVFSNMVPHYISSGSRVEQVWRARLRFNSVSTSPTGKCSLCGSFFNSHRSHIILECPVLDLARSAFIYSANMHHGLSVVDVLEPTTAFGKKASSVFILAIAAELKKVFVAVPS